MAEETNSTDKRIAALLTRLDDADEEIRREVEWLLERFRRSERNLDKISRMSDRMQSQILELNDKLRAASVTDMLTGLTNRRGAQEILLDLPGRVTRGSRPCALVVMDIDHFKTVNDTHGHDVGDQVLVEFSRRVKEALRPEDLAIRWGGEEFLVILPSIPAENARAMLTRLHEILRGTPFPTRAGPLQITASSGLAILARGDESSAAAISRADKALYAAKQAGRDRWIDAG